MGLAAVLEVGLAAREPEALETRLVHRHLKEIMVEILFLAVTQILLLVAGAAQMPLDKIQLQI